ncbi:Outer membrane protein beta-barrel domain-containing protein [Spirosomataceae bacterium TFI 002]|nr:Outer membrane protein beta-barrel domain-containing protein [Spirosomataceae bacterium TFI 002]
MKKISVIITLVMVSFLAKAQPGIGLKAGMNLTNLYTDAGSFGNNVKESLDTRTGFVFGVWGRIGQKVYLQPEILVATRGGEVEIQPFGGGGPEFVDVKYTDLDIPLLVGFRPFKFLRIMAGPVATIKLNEDKKLREALGEYTSNTGEVFKNASYGYQLGAGVKLLGFELDLRKEGSLSDINMSQFAGDPQFSQRANGWTLTLAKKIL